MEKAKLALKAIGVIILAIAIVAAVAMLHHNDYQNWKHEYPAGSYFGYLFDSDWHE